jgi:acid phosphatase
MSQGTRMARRQPGTMRSAPWRLALCISIAAGAPAHAAAVHATPIEHVIIVVGENRTFDNLFGVYQPKSGQTISNLLSKGIVDADGRPGPRFGLAAQRRAHNSGAYSAMPTSAGTYDVLPGPYGHGVPGQERDGPDRRFPASLPNGPFQITRYVGYAERTGDPVHRFFQMWQQVDGGRQDLFVWVGETVGAGPSNDPLPAGPGSSHAGAVAMGFYNMSAGDAPYFKQLADRYAIADNYHQSVMGGTTANYFALVSGDVAVYNRNGRPAVPQPKRIENPDAQAGTDNWYTEDGYAGGSYVECADAKRPGVAGIRHVLEGLPYVPFNGGNCEAGVHYMVNNLDPAYSPTGKPRPADADGFVMSPQLMPSIADALIAAGVSWKWYSGGRRAGEDADAEYCGTCDPLTTFASIMSGAGRGRLQDLDRFFSDARDAATFPAVAVIAPNESRSGHPGSSAEPGFDGLVRDIVEQVRANPALWAKSAVLVTFDEGGGYYDSGYIQFIDFFGDGTRVPLIAVSPFAKAGNVDHTYYDHASILKFIERNWRLAPLSKRSRDNLPNPLADPADPYVPANRPAIGDLMNLFDFAAPGGKR